MSYFQKGVREGEAIKQRLTWLNIENKYLIQPKECVTMEKDVCQFDLVVLLLRYQEIQHQDRIG